jgi:hypothetical protein
MIIGTIDGKLKLKIPVEFVDEWQKHSVSKVKKVASVDPEKLANIEEFVNYAVTENRLEQGIQEVFGDEELSMKKTGDYLKWIVNDIMSEETDTLEANGLVAKDVNKYISTKAREWFKKKIDEAPL